MSDEFLKVATIEINDDISALEKILFSCKTDADVVSSADKFQKHTHKIKGLAPMMGKDDLGILSASLDAIFKKILNGSRVENIFDVLNDSIYCMKLTMAEPSSDLTEIKNRISQIEDILN
jgi:chemotaxis protein histidine kinase CheA